MLGRLQSRERTCCSPPGVHFQAVWLAVRFLPAHPVTDIAITLLHSGVGKASICVMFYSARYTRMIMNSQSMCAMSYLDNNGSHVFHFSTESAYAILSHTMQSWSFRHLSSHQQRSSRTNPSSTPSVSVFASLHSPPRKNSLCSLKFFRSLFR